MRTECSIVMDLLPLYVEDMLSAKTAQYVREHLDECAECQKELAMLKEGATTEVKDEPIPKSDNAHSFKKVMKRMNRQFYTLSYSLIIFFVFLGFGWTNGDNLMYNSLIMPIVGIFGYIIFGWRAVYKMPVLLLAIDTFVCVFNLIEINLLSTIMWTIIYSMFVFVGNAIAFLLHYALRKETKNEE